MDRPRPVPSPAGLVVKKGLNISGLACVAAIACGRLPDRVRLSVAPPPLQGPPYPREGFAARAFSPTYHKQQVEPGGPQLLLLQHLCVRPPLWGVAVLRSGE